MGQCLFATHPRHRKGAVAEYNVGKARAFTQLTKHTGASSSRSFRLIEEDTEGQRELGIHQGHTGRQWQERDYYLRPGTLRQNHF